MPYRMDFRGADGGSRQACVTSKQHVALNGSRIVAQRTIIYINVSGTWYVVMVRVMVRLSRFYLLRYTAGHYGGISYGVITSRCII